ncbi:MAG: InlB B-repeat-containing protein, partial [Lachnospiraceae bacterium]|nr:InlB B-repeat-containing protein [Lachnospiraceae bacterium]
MMITNKNWIYHIWFWFLGCMLLWPASICRAEAVTADRVYTENKKTYVVYDNCTYEYCEESYLTLTGSMDNQMVHEIPEQITAVMTEEYRDVLGRTRTNQTVRTIPVLRIELSDSFRGNFIIPASGRVREIMVPRTVSRFVQKTHFIIYKRTQIDLVLTERIPKIETCFTVYYKSDIANTLRENANSSGWTPEFHYVTSQLQYVLNGGTNSSANPEEYVIGLGTALKEPERKDYQFTGWYTTPDFQNNTRMEQIADTEQENITLYAKWEYAAKVVRDNVQYQIHPDKSVSVQRGEYSNRVTIANTITYNGTEYPVTAISKDAFTDSTITSITIPDNIHTIEPGAFDNCNQLTDVYLYSMTLSLGNVFPKTVHLHAYADSLACQRFRSDGYTGELSVYGSRIRYVLNGGTNSPSNPAVYPWRSYLSLSDPVREQYQFAGWYLDSAFQPESRVDAIYEDMYHDIVLYARWIPVTLEVDRDSSDQSADGQTDPNESDTQSDTQTVSTDQRSSDPSSDQQTAQAVRDSDSTTGSGQTGSDSATTTDSGQTTGDPATTSSGQTTGDPATTSSGQTTGDPATTSSKQTSGDSAITTGTG